MNKFLFLFSVLFFISCGNSSSTENNPPVTNTSTSVEKPSAEKSTDTQTQKVKQSSIKTSEPETNATKQIVEAPMSEEQKEMQKKIIKLRDEQKKKGAEIDSKIQEKYSKKEKVLPSNSGNTIPTKITDSPKSKPGASSSIPTKEVKTDASKIVADKEKPVIKTKEEQKKAEVKKELPRKITKANHDQFNNLLNKYVSSVGNVNYAGLQSDVSKLNTYLNYLESIKVSDLSGRNEKMAFWINAYNAYTLKLIVKNYPISSITKLDGGKPWDVKWIKLNGKTLSLNNIENDILRPVYKDARIHFAVNCAAKSCPPLLNKAWTANNLERNFQKQTKSFISNPQFNKISKKKIEISKIFEWYGEDFGNLVDFLNKYSSTTINSNAKIDFVEYDWSLNK